MKNAVLYQKLRCVNIKNILKQFQQQNSKTWRHVCRHAKIMKWEMVPIIFRNRYRIYDFHDCKYQWSSLPITVTHTSRNISLFPPIIIRPESAHWGRIYCVFPLVSVEAPPSLQSLGRSCQNSIIEKPPLFTFNTGTTELNHRDDVFLN